MINPKASNWVNRGEPAHYMLVRVRSSYLHLEPATHPILTASHTQLSEWLLARLGDDKPAEPSS
jgi:hypothetical protein